MKTCLLLLCALWNTNASLGWAISSANFGDQKDFFFGLATAPAHVEDQLHDAWLRFAKKGHVAAFDNVANPEERLKFWTQPEEDIELAAKSGVKVFRLGVDWGRLAPNAPGSLECQGPCGHGVQDLKALSRYGDIIKMIRDKGMQVMLTLFHHSLPQWSIDQGGWLNEQTPKYFRAFSEDVVKAFAEYVDYWVTFNEPAVFIVLTHLAGIWPPGGSQDPLGFVPGALGVEEGAFFRGVRHMTEVHNELYSLIHEWDQVVADQNVRNKQAAKVGIAHNVSRHVPDGLTDTASALFSRRMLNYKFTDDVADSLDYLGLNYYGAEYIKGTTVAVREDREYSDSGRVVEPYGLYEVLKLFHDRYNVQYLNRSEEAEKEHRQIPLMITENGVSDASDYIRGSYLIEHLLAIHKARTEGVPVLGYVFWTISDNWEWADGYCPKFGLAAVDRTNDLKRTLRPSYSLFSEIVKTGKITDLQRNAAWKIVRDHVGKPRSFCRSADGISSLDEPTQRNVVDLDWRFTGVPLDDYEPLEDSLSALFDSLDAIPNLPGPLASDENREIMKKTLVTFGQAVQDAKFNVESDNIGRSLVGVKLKKGRRIACLVTGDVVPYHLVFDESFYFKVTKATSPINAKLKLDGIRIFVGPTGPGHILTRLPFFRIGDQGLDITVDKNMMSITADAEIPLLKRDIDLTADAPMLECEEVSLDKFPNNIFEVQ